jgi:hypothetical protein
MTTGILLILVALAFALIVSAGITLPRRRRADGGTPTPTHSGQVESELLRRPLRSRYSA